MEASCESAPRLYVWHVLLGAHNGDMVARASSLWLLVNTVIATW
jgi:hypothetical protein